MAKWPNGSCFPFGPVSTHNVIGSCWVQHEGCDVHMHLLSQCSNSLGILPTCNKVCSSLCSCSKPSDNICCCIYVQGIRPVLPRIFRSKVTQEHESLQKNQGHRSRNGQEMFESAYDYPIYSKHTCFCCVVLILQAGGKIKSVIHLAPLTLMSLSLSNFTQWYRDLRLRYSHVCMMSSCRCTVHRIKSIIIPSLKPT